MRYKTRVKIGNVLGLVWVLALAVFVSVGWKSIPAGVAVLIGYWFGRTHVVVGKAE